MLSDFILSDAILRYYVAVAQRAKNHLTRSKNSMPLAQ